MGYDVIVSGAFDVNQIRMLPLLLKILVLREPEASISLNRAWLLLGKTLFRVQRWGCGSCQNIGPERVSTSAAHIVAGVFYISSFSYHGLEVVNIGIIGSQHFSGAYYLVQCFTDEHRAIKSLR